MTFSKILLAAVVLVSPMGIRAADSTAPTHAFPAAGEKGFQDVSVEQFDQLRTTDKKMVVLDVRTPEEFAQGHIPGARLLDFHSPKFAEELAKLPKDQSYLVHCAAGVRSTKTCEQMHRLGFAHMVNLKGGFRAWQAEGKPVEK